MSRLIRRSRDLRARVNGCAGHPRLDTRTRTLSVLSVTCGRRLQPADELVAEVRRQLRGRAVKQLDAEPQHQVLREVVVRAARRPAVLCQQRHRALVAVAGIPPGCRKRTWFRQKRQSARTMTAPQPLLSLQGLGGSQCVPSRRLEITRCLCNSMCSHHHSCAAWLPMPPPPPRGRRRRPESSTAAAAAAAAAAAPVRHEQTLGAAAVAAAAA